MSNVKKVRYKNNIKIVIDDEVPHIYKKNKKDLLKLFDYLKSRNFDSFVDIIDENENGYEYRYIEEVFTPKEQKLTNIASIIGELHTKTSYYKDVGQDKYLEIYELIEENILYIEEYYNDLITLIESERYMSPSHYLIARNYSKIMSAINFCKKELDDWQSLVKDSNRQRVCVVHNNLNSSHILRNDNKDYLISWDNYIIDTPILDLYKLYKNEDILNDFNEILKVYEDKFKLKEDERKLLFIILSIPKKFKLTNNEFTSSVNVREFVDYLFKTNDLITPYYSVDNIDKKED